MLSLREFVIETLEKNPVIELSKIMEATETRYDELKSIINDLAMLKEGIVTAKTYPNTKFKTKLNEQQWKVIKENWTKLH